jgi:hypothetical protein
VQAVVLLMSMYKNDISMQTLAMRVCVRILLGTHVQHGKYLSQVEAIRKFGALGIVKHVVMIMRQFPDSTAMTVYALWLLALMTQNAVNARDAAAEGANAAIVSALQGFAEFGKANALGQKWGAACVTNMCRVQECREEIVECGVLKVSKRATASPWVGLSSGREPAPPFAHPLNVQIVGKLVDNSPNVQSDWSCVVSVLGAITELARKPHFPSRIKLVDLKVQHTVHDMKKRLEDELEQIHSKRGRVRMAGDDDDDDDSRRASVLGMDGEDNGVKKKKLTEVSRAESRESRESPARN